MVSLKNVLIFRNFLNIPPLAALSASQLDLDLEFRGEED